MRPFISHRPSMCLAAALGLLLVPSALAATINVPADQPTIQAAVNAAALTGDVIKISPGTYAESVSISGKQLEIVGVGSVPGDVVIDGDGAFRTLSILADSDVDVQNLTVRGATGNGIRVDESTARFLETAVIENAGNTGGGLSTDGADVVVRRCFFFGNDTTASGGAMYLRQSSVLIEDTLIWNNTFTRGAVFLFESGVEMDRVHFFGNTGSAFGASAMEVGSDSVATITNSVMNGNSGIAPLTVTSGSDLKAINITAADNDNTDAALAVNSGFTVLTNSIVTGSGEPTFTGGGGVSVGYSIGTGLTGPGVIDGDPMFKATGFYQLDAGSPAVDAADGSAIGSTPDFLGRPRFVDDRNVADEGIGTLAYLDMGAIERVPAIRYVKEDATGTGDGTSWTDAMNDLQDALDEAASTGEIEEIWIAAGTYKPDRGTGDRGMSFDMQSGLTILGGFAGTEELRADADASVNQSILGGELGPAGPDGNTFHVVRAINVDETGRLGGVIIQRGNADFGDAVDGGGIRIINGAPQFNEIWIRQCEASGLASAVFASNASPIFNRLRVNRNGWESEPFSTMRLLGGSPAFVNAQIHGNRQSSAGALYFDEADAAIAANLTVWGNTSLNSWCAGVFNFQGELEVLNTIVWGNIALAPIAGQPLSQDNVFGIGPDSRFTTVEGWSNALSNGNNGRDPRFVDAAGPDGIAGTADDDLRLSAGSCLIDSGDSTLLPAIFATDVFGVERFLNDPGTADTGVADADGMVVDRGAHEFAGVSCGGDVDGSGDVGFSDLLQVLASWGACVNCAADVNCDDVVDFDDLLTVLAAWGPCP